MDTKLIEQFFLGKVCSFNGEDWDWAIMSLISLNKVLLVHLDTRTMRMAATTEIILRPDLHRRCKPLEGIINKDWRIVQKRYAILETFYTFRIMNPNLSEAEVIHQISADSNVSQRQLFQWKKLFELSGDISTLLPHKKSRSLRKTKTRGQVSVSGTK